MFRDEPLVAIRSVVKQTSYISVERRFQSGQRMKTNTGYHLCIPFATVHDAPCSGNPTPSVANGFMYLLVSLLFLASHTSLALGIGHIVTDLSPLGSIDSQIREMTLPSKINVFSAAIERSHYQFLAFFLEVTLIGKSHSSRGSLPVCWWIIQENDSGELFRRHSQYMAEVLPFHVDNLRDRTFYTTYVDETRRTC